MNIYIPILISTLPFYAVMGVLFYFAAVRKNTFEERVAHYIPYHALDNERRQYIEKVEKYKRYICIGMGIFLSLMLVAPLIPLFVMTSQQEVNLGGTEELSLLFIPLSFILLVYYLLSYVVKRNAQAQHLLLEEMSDHDFAYLLKMQKNLPWLRKYFPFFILCKGKLYFLTFFTIREVDPKKVEKIRSWYSKGNRTVLIRYPKRFITSMTERVYPHLETLIKKYNPIADIKS